MKMLTLTALLCAMMALTRAAALPDAEAEPAGAESHVVKRFTYCPIGWTLYNRRCFLFVPREMKWAQAEKNCQSIGGNLASVHSIQEYQEIQRIIVGITHDYRLAWIGGSDAQEERYWFWSDGTSFHFSAWCRGEPNNLRGQHCLQINHGDQKCWDDFGCHGSLPSVCARSV